MPPVSSCVTCVQSMIRSGVCVALVSSTDTNTHTYPHKPANGNIFSVYSYCTDWLRLVESCATDCSEDVVHEDCTTIIITRGIFFVSLFLNTYNV